MKIETQRLFLIPYTVEQMKSAIANPAATAADAGFILEKPRMTEYFSRARIYNAKVKLMKLAPSAWLLSTYWQMVCKDTKQIVGELGFKGPPENRELEIGYGTGEKFRNKGYMSEAVGALCEYALTQNDFQVRRVVAATERKNYASHRVLERNGFTRAGMMRGLIMWHKNKPV